MSTGNLPSVKKLNEAFPDHGKEVREILEGKRKAKDYKSVQDWVKVCLHQPSAHDKRMCAINEVVGGHGVEAIFRIGDELRPDMEYINIGHSDIPTLIYDFTTGTFKVQDTLTWQETSERRGRRYE